MTEKNEMLALAERVLMYPGTLPGVGHVYSVTFTEIEAQQVADALRAAASAEPVAWQPIKTAPREQTILVAGGDAPYPVTACWSGLSDECWMVDGQEDVHAEIGWPTHWMPLPEFSK